jgi:predicted transcriptional regulator
LGVLDFMSDNNTNSVTLLIEDAIENGVKDTKSDEGYMNHLKQQHRAEQTIEDGVKETKEDRLFRTIHVMNAIVNGVKHVEDGDWLDQDERINDIIESGVKELKELPDKSGEFRGYGDWYRTQGNMTKPHTEYVKEVIEDSYNHRARIEGVIKNTDKDGI